MQWAVRHPPKSAHPRSWMPPKTISARPDAPQAKTRPGDRRSHTGGGSSRARPRGSPNHCAARSSVRNRGSATSAMPKMSWYPQSQQRSRRWSSRSIDPTHPERVPSRQPCAPAILGYRIGGSVGGQAIVSNRSSLRPGRTGAPADSGVAAGPAPIAPVSVGRRPRYRIDCGRCDRGARSVRK